MRLSFQKIKNLVLFLAIVPVRLPDFSCSPLFYPRQGLFLKTVGFKKNFFKKKIYIWIKMGNFIILAITLSVILVTVIILKVFA